MSQYIHHLGTLTSKIHRSVYMSSLLWIPCPTTSKLKSYQGISSFRRGDGKHLIENVKPCLGDTILGDCVRLWYWRAVGLFCWAGGSTRQVVAVDSDIDRIQVARESHKGIENLTFIEGSAENFPGIGLDTYDIVFANYVLHWISDKKLAFMNMHV